MVLNPDRFKVRVNRQRNDIAAALSRKLIGQPAAIEAIVPYVVMHRALLSPDGRPAGVFLLLGPTGTGKTKTVEALAEVLHGSSKKLLRVDCGEFQLEHEMAKLLGAPPGYLGHRETQPLLTQQKLNGVSSESCDLSLLLFDEIEKAAISVTRLLLGILDKATLRLGDNTTVNFEKTMIFMTSNLGGVAMLKQLCPEFGFKSMVPVADLVSSTKLHNIGVGAMRKNFSPEFVNRIDATVTYQPLSSAALTLILDHQIFDLQDHIDKRLGSRSFRLTVTLRARKFLLEKGTSTRYGARELRRTLERELVQPLASLLAAGEINPGSHVRVELSHRKDKLVLRTADPDYSEPLCA